jgi:hypothetical protein
VTSTGFLQMQSSASCRGCRPNPEHLAAIIKSNGDWKGSVGMGRGWRVLQVKLKVDLRCVCLPGTEARNTCSAFLWIYSISCHSNLLECSLQGISFECCFAPSAGQHAAVLSCDCLGCRNACAVKCSVQVLPLAEISSILWHFFVSSSVPDICAQLHINCVRGAAFKKACLQSVLYKEN